MKMRNSLNRGLALVGILMLSMMAFAQQARTVKGKVTDEKGETIPGVNVSIQGTTIGTITDMDGSYVLEVPNADKAVLVFSFIGYQPVSVVVAGQSTVNSTMKEDAVGLNEVVAIGYGVVTRRDITGAVASVKSEDLKQTPVSNVAQALQGKMAGVTISSQDGRPGAEVSIRVRGGGSLTQSNDPLIVVDGIPGGSLSDIPADMIESIDVLKDAASTAIYGARGANGVVLVTTKGLKSPKGKVSVSYSGYYQTKQLSNTLESLDAQDYVLHQWSYATAYGSDAVKAVTGYFGLGSLNGNHYAEYANVKAHNYTDDLLRNAVSKDHNISITSNNEKTIVAFNANFNNDEGIKINSSYKRFNTALKVETELYKNLRVGFDIKYVQTTDEGSEAVTGGKGTVLSSAYLFAPIDAPLGTGDLSLYSGFGNGDVNLDPTYNPYKRTMDIVDNTERQKFNGTGYLNWVIVKGLTARTELAGNRNYSENHFYDNGVASTDKTATLKLSRGYGYRSTSTLNWEVQGLDDHSVSMLLGNDISKSNTDNTRIFGKGYPENFDYETTMGMMEFVDYSSKSNYEFENKIGNPTSTVSFFSRFNYGYKGRYLLTATLRADGSSKFAPNNRWGYFPAGAFAWRVSDEPFMDGTKGWLDNMKMRLSYGSAGTDNIPYDAWNELYDISFAADGKPIAKPKGYLSNPDLKWETTISRNIGVDLSFFKTRVYSNIDVYWNNTKDLLGLVPIDPSTGYSGQYQNIGVTSNKGIEVLLGADIIRKKDFKVGVTATYNYNKNNIDELTDNVVTSYGTLWASTSTAPLKDFLFKEGISVGTVQGYVSEGFYTTNDFDYNATSKTYTLKAGVPYYASNITLNYPNPFTVVRVDEAGKNVSVPGVFPGALKLKDVSGNGTITEDDITELGSTVPKHTGGFGVNMYYKGIDMSAGFTYSIGGKVYNIASLFNTTGRKDYSLGANRMGFIKDAYKVYDVNASGDLVPVIAPADLDALNANAQSHLPYYEGGVVLSSFIEDASYLRLNTLTVGYTLPSTLTKKVAVQRLRVYVTGGNLLTVTGYSGLDPEVNTNDATKSLSNSAAYPTPGLDYGAYPRTRTFTFGLSVEF